MPRLATPSVLVLLAACAPRQEAPPAAEVTAPAQVAVAEGFATPESAIHDPDLDLWFVTNINGVPSEKDGNGFISRVRPDGTLDSLRFIAGGLNGVTLNAPKGTAIVGDTLWVADIDAVRGTDCGQIIRNLIEMELIEMTGRADVIGKPYQYGTPRKFLEVFGLKSLDDLPRIEDLAID